MHKTWLVALIPLGACAAGAQPVMQTPVHGLTPAHRCTTAGTARLIGKMRSKRMGSTVLKVTHAAVLRWAPPHVMLTMDFRADRATVHLGADNRITKIECV